MRTCRGHHKMDSIGATGNVLDLFRHAIGQIYHTCVMQSSAMVEPEDLLCPPQIWFTEPV